MKQVKIHMNQVAKTFTEGRIQQPATAKVHDKDWIHGMSTVDIMKISQINPIIMGK